MKEVINWLKSGMYLPEILRDFHDQKDIFKAMHRQINIKKNHYASQVNWLSGQCYVIDVFLWFMAMHGYTLQKTRKKCDFKSIETSVKKDREQETEFLKQFLTPPQERADKEYDV